MTRWTLLLLSGITLSVALMMTVSFAASSASKSQTGTWAPARSHETTRQKGPIRLFHPKTAAKYKLVIIKRIARHAEHVRLFFEAHPRQARSKAGRAALWRQMRILRVALREVRKVRRELWLTLPNTNDWLSAVQIAQRPYPGTASQQRYISDREGGFGIWVWYSGSCSNSPCRWRGYHIGGSPDVVGGNMQYRYSTFIGHWHAAVKDLKRRGFKIPDLGWARPYVVEGTGTGYGPWLSPLGQALASGWAFYYNKEGCHWCL